MAKVNGPFMSLSASGTFADTLVASIWKGRPYMRQRVIPANPRTAGQTAVRVTLGAMAKSVSVVLTLAKDTINNTGSQFFEDTRDAAPSGQSWISWYQQRQNSVGDTILSAYGALSGTIQGYFEAGADDAGLTDYVPTFVENTFWTKGVLLFASAYFASNNLGGAIKTLADLAIAGASQTPIDNWVLQLTDPA